MVHLLDTGIRGRCLLYTDEYRFFRMIRNKHPTYSHYRRGSYIGWHFRIAIKVAWGLLSHLEVHFGEKIDVEIKGLRRMNFSRIRYEKAKTAVGSLVRGTSSTGLFKDSKYEEAK